jgi:hypothetical protein
MTGTGDISREAGELFRSAADFSFEDAMQRRLRYHLLRLTVLGLNQDDVEAWGDLGRLAFEDSDVTEHSTKIKERADASVLAFAIADIVERGSSGRPASVSLGTVLVGAVLSADAALSGIPQEEESTVAVLGAIGDATEAHERRVGIGCVGDGLRRAKR